ncbi:MAG TPA: O-antigen ligase family protein [Longimicrobium sp.]
MRDALLVFWIATMGADRIDLLGGGGPVTMPPYLVLMPLLLMLELPALGAMRRVELRREGQVYLALAMLLGGLAMASAVGSSDPELSGKRAVLLVFQLFTILFVAVVLANRPDPASILVRGAYLGLLVSFVFNVAQIGVWLNDPGAVGGGFVDLVPVRFGSIMPRPGGQTLDPNRGGIVSAVFLFLIYRFGRPSKARGVAAVVTVFSLILTLSRSAVMGAMGMMAAALAERRRVRFTRGRLAAGLLASAAAILGVFVVPGALDVLAAAGELLGARFTAREGTSNSIHFQLIERALDVAGRSWKNALIGIGFGNAGSVLTDLLPGTRYANFHSFYATLLAEMGLFALLVGLVITLYPVVRRTPFRPVMVGFLLFNLFYQLLTEPAFWLMLSCAWLGVGVAARDPEPAPGAPLVLPLPARAGAG